MVKIIAKAGLKHFRWSLIVSIIQTSKLNMDPFFSVHIFVYNDSHLSLNQQYVLPNVCLFDLILYVPSTIFQLNRDGSSWVESVLSYDKCVLLKDHNAVTPVRHYRLLTQKSPVLNTTCSLHMGYTGIMRDINIVELSPHRECPMRFFFQNGLQLCHISKETHAF